MDRSMFLVRLKHYGETDADWREVMALGHEDAAEEMARMVDYGYEEDPPWQLTVLVKHWRETQPLEFRVILDWEPVYTAQEVQQESAS